LKPSFGADKDADHIKTTIQLALAVERGTLIDFETTGIPGRTPTHEVVTLGYIRGNTLEVIQRKSVDPKPFYEELRALLTSLSKPFYSYSSGFEREIMRTELGLDVGEGDLIDIMQPWKEKADDIGIKWPRLDELISEPNDYYLADKVSGKDVPRLWNGYLRTGAELYLTPIMEHCLSDILRETMLMVWYRP